MPIEFLDDLVGDQLRPGEDQPKRFPGLFPTIERSDHPPVRHRDDQLDRCLREAALVPSTPQPGDGGQPEEPPSDQFLPMALQERSEEFGLPPRLSNGSGRTRPALRIHATPAVAARAIG